MALRPSLRRSAARPKSLTQNLRRLILRRILRKEGRFRGYVDIRSQLFRVVVATVGSMILGSLWYSPLLFSGLWLRLIGKTSDEIREQGGMIKGIVTSTIGGLITAYVLALVIKATGSTSLVDGLLVALWIWLGFVATSSVLAFVYQQRPIWLWMLENGNHLLSLAVMGIVIGAWQ